MTPPPNNVRAKIKIRSKVSMKVEWSASAPGTYIINDMIDVYKNFGMVVCGHVGASGILVCRYNNIIGANKDERERIYA